MNVNEDSPLIDLTKPMRRDVVSRGPKDAACPSHLSLAEIRLARTRLDCATFSTRVRGLLVGENPGKNTHPDMPLFPWPEKSSAGRLMAMSHLTPGEYLGGLYRRNVCYGREWSRQEARATAREIITVLFDMPRDLAVIVCGVKAAEAFGLSGDFWDPIKLDSRQTAIVIPHPSGLNRIYNDPQNMELTGAWMRWAATGDHER